MSMRSLFTRRSRAQVQVIVVRNAETSLNELHVIITATVSAEAGAAIEEAFEGVVSRHHGDPEFGGDIMFVVYGTGPAGAGLAPELAQARQGIESKVAAANLGTTQGRPFRVRVEQRQSSF